MKNKKPLLIIAISFIIIIISLIIFIFLLVNKDTIYENVYINKINVQGMTKSEAYDTISKNCEFGTLSLIYNNKKWQTDLKDAGFNYKVQDAVDKAIAIGRNQDTFQNILKIINLSYFSDKEYIDLDYTHNYKKIEEFCNKVGKELNSDPIEASISIENDKITITAGRDGKKLIASKIINELKEKIENDKEKDIDIKIPFDTKSPKLKYKELSQINGVISSFQTDYRTSVRSRAWNVELSASKIDNQLLMPGEEVSFLQKIGKITYSEGFRPAPVIINNEYKNGIGGGVCQVSTTLYNALLEGNVEIKERSNHTFPAKYVPIGRDATVGDTSPDLKYKNNYPFPIFIKTYAQNGILTAKVYGDTTKAKKVQIYSERTSYIYPYTIYKKDSSLPKGTQIVESYGQLGQTSVTYKMEDGEKIIISKDRYSAKPKIIRVGAQ